MFALPKNMINAYLVRRQQDVKVLEQSVAQGSVEEFHRIGHQLIGNAKSFGFPELETLAIQMEDISTNNLATKGPVIIGELEKWLQSTH